VQNVNSQPPDQFRSSRGSATPGTVCTASPADRLYFTHLTIDVPHLLGTIEVQNVENTHRQQDLSAGGSQLASGEVLVRSAGG